MKLSTLKKRFISALWFGCSGYVAAIIGTYFQLGLYAFTNPYAFAGAFIGLFLGACFGNKIIDCAEKNAWKKAIGYGFLGGLLSLALIDLGIIFIITGFALSHCLPHASCSTEFIGAWKIFLVVPLVSVLGGGWAAILMGIVSSFLLYKYFKSH